MVFYLWKICSESLIHRTPFWGSLPIEVRFRAFINRRPVQGLLSIEDFLGSGPRPFQVLQFTEDLLRVSMHKRYSQGLLSIGLDRGLLSTQYYFRYYSTEELVKRRRPSQGFLSIENPVRAFYPRVFNP